MAGAFEEAMSLTGARLAPATAGAFRIATAAPPAGALVEIRLRDDKRGLLLVPLPEDAPAAELDVQDELLRPSPMAEGDLSGTLDVVRAWETDVMGHMNVQFYVSRVSSTEAFLVGSHANGPTRVVRPREQRFRFSGELKAGEAVASCSTVLDRGRGKVRIEIYGGGRSAAIVESDLDTDGDVAIADLLPDEPPPTTSADPVWTAGSWEPDPASLPRLTVLGRQEVAAWEVDHTGVMAPRFFFTRMAQGVPHLLGQMGLDRPYMIDNGLGRAAVGYRIAYRRWPKAGDCIELCSGIGLVREKSWRFRHAFVDVADGEILCVSEAVIVLFDLTTRRSAPLPQEIRDKARSLEI